MAGEKFDFISSYRDLQPGAAREVIEAREKAFIVLAKEGLKGERVVFLSGLAFGTPGAFGQSSLEWFVKPIVDEDRLFSLTHDREEAARIATLLLNSWVLSGMYRVAGSVLAASFAGRRSTDLTANLIALARACLANTARSLNSGPTLKKIEFPPVTDKAAILSKLGDDFSPSGAGVALEAIAKDYQAQGAKFAGTVWTAVDALLSHNQRLSDEINLLWWHIGGHSDLLNHSLSDLPSAVRPLFVGADMANMVATFPGPYGAYGIIKHALSGIADEKQSVLDALKQLNPQQRVALKSVLSEPTDGIFVVSYALHLTDLETMSLEEFKSKTGIDINEQLSRYELAVQIYEEGLYQSQGWVKNVG